MTAPLFAWSLTNGRGWPFDVWLSFIMYALCTVLAAWLASSLPASIDSLKV